MHWSPGSQGSLSAGVTAPSLISQNLLQPLYRRQKDGRAPGPELSPFLCSHFFSSNGPSPTLKVIQAKYGALCVAVMGSKDAGVVSLLAPT